MVKSKHDWSAELLTQYDILILQRNGMRIESCRRCGTVLESTQIDQCPECGKCRIP